MPAAVADKKGEYLERTIYSTFSGGKQLAGFQVKRDFIGAGRNLWDKRDYVQYFYRQTNWRYTDSGGNWNDVSCSRILSRGTVGVGDGWILAALGTLLSTEIYVQMLCMGLFFAAGWSGVLLAVFGKSRKTEIPLVPFLLAGYIGAVLL